MFSVGTTTLLKKGFKWHLHFLQLRFEVAGRYSFVRITTTLYGVSKAENKADLHGQFLSSLQMRQQRGGGGGGGGGWGGGDMSLSRGGCTRRLVLIWPAITLFAIFLKS